MKQYLQILKQVTNEGVNTVDQNGKESLNVFGIQTKFNLLEGFPISTTREISTKDFIEEILWYIRGSNNVTELNNVGVHIWDEFAVKESDVDNFLVRYNGFNLEDNAKENPADITLSIGNIVKPPILKAMLNRIGFIYGDGFRSTPCSYLDFANYYPTVSIDDFSSDRVNKVKNYIVKNLNENPVNNSDKRIMRQVYYGYIDQLNLLIEKLKKNINSNELIINTWIPEWLPFEDLSPQENVLIGKGSIAPTIISQQYNVINLGGDKKYLSMLLNVRKCDLVLDGLLNISKYSLLLSMIAQVVDMIPYELILTIGDAYICKDHLKGVNEQLTRNPLTLPKLKLNLEINDIFNFRSNDIEIINYKHHDPIEFDVSV